MELLYLSKTEVQNLGVTMGQILEAVGAGLGMKGRGEVQMPQRATIRTVADSYVHAMPVYAEGSEVCGAKWMSGYRSNPLNGLPYINGLMILNDASNGVPVAVMDCAEITAMRTGATVGIAAKYLARDDSSVVGILGCGVQARRSLVALMEVLPKLALVRCYDIAAEAADEFVAEMEAQFPLTSFVICDSVLDMVHFADVVVSATPIVDEPKPSLHAGMLKEGALAVALDYDASWSPAAKGEWARLVTDDVEHLAFAKVEGVHFRDMPLDGFDDLGDIVAGNAPGRVDETERVLCLSLGTAVADIVVAKLLYDRALKHEIGRKLPL